jgi:hypothetical protein
MTKRMRKFIEDDNSMLYIVMTEIVIFCLFGLLP